MFRVFFRPIPLMLLLVMVSAIPVLNALVQVFQIPTGNSPDDSAHLAVAPYSWFAHVFSAVAFGVTGPVQFVRALRQRFGVLHRVAGRIFVVAGTFLGVSGLSILVQVTSQRTPLADVARGLFGVALLVALTRAMAAVFDRDFVSHRAWAIRAWAIGMGSGSIALIFFPIYVVTGQAPTGLAADILFVGSWLMTVVVAEVIARRRFSVAIAASKDPHSSLAPSSIQARTPAN